MLGCSAAGVLNTYKGRLRSAGIVEVGSRAKVAELSWKIRAATWLSLSFSSLAAHYISGVNALKE